MTRPRRSSPRSVAVALAAAMFALTGARGASGEAARALTLEEAVRVALQRNRDVIAARLRIEEAKLDRVAAEVYPNPVLSYTAANLVLGEGNPASAASGSAPRSPGFFAQPVHTVSVSQVLDVWSKRGLRARVAEQGIEATRLEVEDALRQIVREVEVAFTDVVREQAERDLSREVRDRYQETVRLSRARFEAGEISQAELDKIELEGLKYQQEAVDAEMQLDVARLSLSGLLALGSAEGGLPLLEEPSLDAVEGDLEHLTARALAIRPDLQALRKAREMTVAMVSREKREVLPDITVGVGYTRSTFLASGDNPNTMGVGVSLPLPLFDRNRAGIGKALLATQRAENEIVRLELQVQRDVADAARRVTWSKARLELFEAGGMLDRADRALRVAERSYRAGAISLLELLEAERTYLDTKAQYLRARDERKRSIIDLLFALGERRTDRTNHTATQTGGTPVGAPSSPGSPSQ